MENAIVFFWIEKMCMDVNLFFIHMNRNGFLSHTLNFCSFPAKP